MGNNNYQFRLQSLDVLDQYVAKLKQEAEQILVYPMNFLKTITNLFLILTAGMTLDIESFSKAP